MLKRFIPLVAIGLFAGSIANANSFVFHCPGHSKERITAALCFIEAEKQLLALGCKAKPPEGESLACGGKHGADTCGALVLEDCASAGKSTNGRAFNDGGTQTTCVERYGSDAKFVANKNKNPYFPGICKISSKQEPASSDGTRAAPQIKR